MIKDAETIIALVALVISIVSLISSFLSNKYDKISVREQVYDRFSKMWYDMDEVFIKNPQMHKYFYRNNETGRYGELKPGDKDYELGICIAELFDDLFQYTKPLEKYLRKDDLASYNDYKKMIMDSPIVQTAKRKYKWHEGEVQ